MDGILYFSEPNFKVLVNATKAITFLLSSPYLYQHVRLAHHRATCAKSVINCKYDREILNFLQPRNLGGEGHSMVHPISGKRPPVIA
jgi:hypothetical protein